MQPSRRSQRTRLPALTPLFIGLSLAVPGAAHAAGPLPAGGQFVAGTGSIGGNASTLEINQTSTKGIIDWTSFSIGAGNRVNIANGAGTTLNRVTGTSLSTILGTLSATGSVYLINPQGIVVGSSGVVSTGGRFVASTLDVDNDAFMKGGPLTFTSYTPIVNNVVNLGKISSSGGDVFLLATSSIVNSGTISAPKGSVEMAVGGILQLKDSSTGQQVSIDYLNGSGGTVINRGVIEAAQINVQAADGNIYAFAGNHAVMRATSTSTRNGHVWLVADTGKVTIDGTIEARNADGSGGVVDTNAAHLIIADDTNAKPAVNAGQWNITAPSFAVTGLAAPVLQRSLNNGTSINVQTTGADGSGDIDVAANVQWAGAASLTLGAYRSLTIDAAAKLKNTGTGNLTLRADSTAIDNGGSIDNQGTVDWSASMGDVSAFYDMNGSFTPGQLLANASWTPPAFSGLVTQFTGYKLLDSLADLEKISSNLAGNYALGKDIDASATSNGSYVPIGSGTTAFTGQFDGQGHTIHSLTLQGLGEYDWDHRPVTFGLFGTIGASAVVRDLNVNGTISISEGNEFKSGAEGVEGMLAADNFGTIVRSSASGRIDNLDGGTWFDVTTAGGLVGVNHGTIERSSSSVSAKVGGTFGDLVGENDGAISQSFASGAVVSMDTEGGSQNSVGTPAGFVAVNNGSITQSYETGAVSTAPLYQNGFAAAFVNVNRGTISQSFATGAVTGANPGQGGGLAAENDGTIANDVYWDKNATGMTSGVGGGIPMSAASGLTTAQMSNPANFSGWRFGSNGVWAMPAGSNHPVLRWQVDAPASE